MAETQSDAFKAMKHATALRESRERGDVLGERCSLCEWLVLNGLVVIRDHPSAIGVAHRVLDIAHRNPRVAREGYIGVSERVAGDAPLDAERATGALHDPVRGLVVHPRTRVRALLHAEAA